MSSEGVIEINEKKSSAPTDSDSDDSEDSNNSEKIVNVIREDDDDDDDDDEVPDLVETDDDDDDGCLLTDTALYSILGTYLTNDEGKNIADVLTDIGNELTKLNKNIKKSMK